MYKIFYRKIFFFRTRDEATFHHTAVKARSDTNQEVLPMRAEVMILDRELHNKDIPLTLRVS